MTRFAPGILRIVLVFWLLGGAIWFGFSGNPPLVILGLALVFTLTFGIGKWRAWVLAKEHGQLARAVLDQASTFIVQAILAGIFYLAGRGVASVASMHPGPSFNSSALLLWGVIGIALGFVLIWLEKETGTVSGISRPAVDPDAPSIPNITVTEDNFFQAHHFSNQKFRGDIHAGTYKGTTIDDKAYLSEAQLAAEEDRLGISLPPLLRRLYLRQNGGSAMSLLAQTDVDFHNAEDGWIAVFSGYDDMVPLTEMRSLKASIGDYAYSDEQPEEFPDGCDQMFILAQWYRETLFLDYRKATSPRVGFCDFDNVGVNDLRDPAWEGRAEWWEDFDTFFAALKRRPEEVRDADDT